MRINIHQFERSLAIFLLLTFPILIITTGKVLPSISSYAYSSQHNLFVALLTIAATMFLYNYAGNNKHWYNIILGISLLGIALTPFKENGFAHFTFAGIFFGTSIFSIGLSSSIYLRKYKWYIAIFSALGLGLVPFGFYSLAIGEFIAMLPISFHFYIKSLDAAKQNNFFIKILFNK